MPLSLSELQDIQADAMADDVVIDFERMSMWTADQASKYFESGGMEEPTAPVAAFTAPFTSGTKATAKTPWLASVPKESEAPTKFRVVCFSWTGNRGGQGSAHNLRRVPVPWAKELGNEVALYEVAYTGRGTRMKEALFSDPTSLVAEMAKALGEALADGPPTAFVGFAFGAILAYEVARAIQAASGATQGPKVVVSVSCEGPGWTGRAAGSKKEPLGLSRCSEDAFRAALTTKGGTDFILKDAGMSKMYLPVIRADITLEEDYAPPSDGKAAASFPIIAMFGATAQGRDKEKSAVSPDAAELWGDATTAPCKVVAVPGVDWYVLQEAAGVAAVLREVKGALEA